MAIALARARLAALADTAATVEESVRFERGVMLPHRLEWAVERPIDLGGDGLSLELLLAHALGCQDCCRGRVYTSA